MGESNFQSLDDYLGTSSPIWKLSNSSDELVLSATGGDTERSVRVKLKARQVTQIKRLTGATAVLFLDVQMLGRPVRLHLVGKKITTSDWAGVAAALGDPEAVAQNSMQALAFAEEIVSEVNSIVVILDKTGTIRRFNRKAEEYTGCKEVNVIGENAQSLFMSPTEGTQSRRNIERFFDEGRSYDVERVIETAQGARPFLFRNRFIKSKTDASSEFIVCSGVEIAFPRGTLAAEDVDSVSTPVVDETHYLGLMNRIMDWAALVDGARTLLEKLEEGNGDPRSLANAIRLAASAVRDAYTLYDDLDAQLAYSQIVPSSRRINGAQKHQREV
ncbi:PAS domain S-box protein [Burkholderia ubonensis]|nr:PAS domain S-box protein [Burkholderia ubonensis]